MDKASEDVLVAIQNLSGPDTLDRLNQKLNGQEDVLRNLATTPANDAAEGGGGPAGQTALLVLVEALEPQQHTLGIAHLLAAQSQSLESPHKRAFVDATAKFLLNFDGKQARQAAKKFVMVVHKFTSTSFQLNLTAKAMRPLKLAASNFAPRSHTLTPVDADFLQVALLSKCYLAAAEFMHDREIFDVDPKATGLTSVDLLRYYYYGGLVHIGLKKFNEAMDFFKTAVTVPATALSAVVVESYKKMVLVSLLASPSELAGSKSSLLPKYTSTVVSRHIKQTAQPYHDIATAYQSEKPNDLRSLLEKHGEVLVQDGNLGLAKQLIKSLVGKKIRKLTRAYVTLSLQDIARQADLPDAATAEKYIVEMVDNGDVVAQIDQVTQMVYFREEKLEDYNSNQTLHRLDKELQTVVDLAERVRQLDVQISTSQAYLQKTSGGGRGGHSGLGVGEAAGGGPDAYPEDLIGAGDDFGSYLK